MSNCSKTENGAHKSERVLGCRSDTASPSTHTTVLASTETFEVGWDREVIDSVDKRWQMGTFEGDLWY
eukprot:scaffold2548_cov147-Skeletonema_menzelii.AAC.12